MFGKGKLIQSIPSWMLIILWVSLCVVGLHFLADNTQHASMAWGIDLPVGKNAGETFDEHQAEMNFVLPDDGKISSPFALAISFSPDGPFSPLVFVIPLLNPPRA